MSTQSVGLLIFLIVQALNLAGVSLDFALVEHGLPTVTEFGRRNPWLAAIIIIINIVGLVGLAMHFSNGRD